MTPAAPKIPDGERLCCFADGCENVVRFVHTNPDLTLCDDHFDVVAAAHGVDESDFTLVNVEGSEEKNPEAEFSTKYEKVPPKGGFPWPVLLLLATCYMRHFRLPFAGIRAIPQDAQWAGSQWHITRHPTNEGEYTLIEKTGHFDMIELHKERDERQAEMKQHKRALGVWKERLAELQSNGDPANERDHYEKLVDEASTGMNKAEHDFLVLDKRASTGSLERKWRVNPTTLPDLVDIPGVTAVKQQKGETNEKAPINP